MSRQRDRTPVSAPLRVVPPKDLVAYVVYEHDLDLLTRGSPASLLLNFALFFLGVAASGFGTLFSLPPDNDRAYYTVLILALMTGIAGVVLIGLWWFTHQSVKNLVAEIKAQTPPNPPARLQPNPPQPPA